MDYRAKASQMLGVGRDDIALDHRQHLRQHLEDRDLAAQGCKHCGKLHADDPATDHGETPRHVFQLQDLVGIDRQLGPRQLNPRHRRTRRDHDVPGLD